MRLNIQLDEIRARITRRVVILAVVVAVVVAAVATTAVVLLSSGPQYEITADFVATPGLYPDNAVDILGVPDGHIVSVKPQQSYVAVVLALPRSVKVPANAQAVLMAPDPVSDRFVQLTPPYTGGPVLAPGSVIPLARTVVPLELDQVYQSVDNLSTLLGPSGANSNGQLSAALHALAQLANGNGADVHTAIDTIAAALPALTAKPDELSALITGLDTLTRTLAGRDATINALYGDLSTATGQLADERQTIAAAIANLQRGVAEVASFISANQSHIGNAVRNLATTVSAVMQEQQALINTFDTAALGFQNFNNAIALNTDCASATGAPDTCAALWGRLDFTQGAANFLKQYCGNSIFASFLPILQWNAHLGPASALDTACGAEIGLLQNRVAPPGSPAMPDLDLTHYLGSQ